MRSGKALKNRAGAGYSHELCPSLPCSLVATSAANRVATLRTFPAMVRSSPVARGC
jgi:hypothetical protein